MRLKLRHFKTQGVQNYFKAHDAVAARNFNNVPISLEDAEKEIQNFIKEYKTPFSKRKEECFVIIYDKQFAGWVSVHDITYRHKAVVGILIAPEFRSRGLATDALVLAVRKAFKNYKLHRISGRVRSFNKASARMLEKAGFSLEGIHKKNHYRDGKYHDNLVYSIVK